MGTSAAWLDRYAAVRVTERAAGANPEGAEMAALLDAFSPYVRYVDVPTGGVWEGRAALREMIVKTYASVANDILITVTGLVDGGRRFALEGEARGTNIGTLGEAGRTFVIRWTSVGTFDDDGRVKEQRDYWDRKGWLMEIGVDDPWRAAI